MVVVGAKPVKEEKDKQEKQQSDFDWQEFSGNFMAQITRLLTVVVLANAIAKMPENIFKKTPPSSGVFYAS